MGSFGEVLLLDEEAPSLVRWPSKLLILGFVDGAKLNE